MKKVLLVILFSLIAILLVSLIRINHINYTNDTLKAAIKEQKVINEKAKNNNKDYQIKVDEAKEKAKEKWEEKEIWIKAKEKLEKALS